mgnify:CR=1 FL=1
MLFFSSVYNVLNNKTLLSQEPHLSSGIPGECQIPSISFGSALCAGFTGKSMVD